MKNGVLILGALLWVISCSTYKITKQRYVSVLTFNVENLFDTEHDLGKMDYTYLPLSVKKTTLKQSVDSYCATVKNPAWKKECKELDWSDKKLNEKLLRLSRVIEEATSGCADILSRFETRTVVNHTIPFLNMDAEGRKDTRSLLDAEFSIDGFALRVMALHLPSPHRPASFRQDAVKFIESLYFKDPIATVVAGDWNVPGSEEAKHKTFQSFRKSFQLSDDVIRTTSKDAGSTYYKKDKSWSFLDKIALSRNSFDSVSCKVVNFLPGQRDRGVGAPQPFPLFGKLGEGISDHFPVLCRASY
jgi:endonuclease/exonuclease/phosphatase family metal-dependent hydrolase